MEKKIVREFITNAANEAYDVLILISIVELHYRCLEVQKVESLFYEISQLKSILFGQEFSLLSLLGLRSKFL